MSMPIGNKENANGINSAPSLNSSSPAIPVTVTNQTNNVNTSIDSNGSNSADSSTLTSNSNSNSNTVSLLDEPKIKSILISDSSLDILLTKLKQSIKSTEEFATFIKKKHSYEFNYAREMKKVSVNIKTSIRQNFPTSNPNSTINTLDKIVNFDDKMIKDVRDPYIKALEKMYEELSSLASNFSLLRKKLKDEGLKREKYVIDIISSAEKSKNKYNSLCNELEKLRNNNLNSNSNPNQKKLTIKGTKTNSQQEEELIRKIGIADKDYKSKSSSCQVEKKKLIEVHRPKLSNNLKNLILEIDNAFILQLTKYSIFNESLIIGMGNQISPLISNKEKTNLSMKSVTTSIDIEKNLYNYLKGSKVETKSGFVPIEYKKHLLFGGSSNSKQPSLTASTASSRNVKQPIPHNVPPIINYSSMNPNQNSNSNISAPIPVSNISKQDNFRMINQDTSYSNPPDYNTTIDSQDSSIAKYPSLDPVLGGASGAARSNSGHNSRNASQDYDSSLADTNSNSDNDSITHSFTQPQHPQQQPSKLFGVPIEYVAHDDEMIPLFVKKCIHIIETYGQNSEGIYRSSPNVAKVEELKNRLNQDPMNFAKILEPEDPNNINDDYIYCIASLLKLFFTSLPDPLLTREESPVFLKAGEIEDTATMHLHLHRAVFNLPDASYFTLRDLLFHFNNITTFPKVRMNIKNLSIVWCNNLLGCEFTSKEEFEIQQRVITELIIAAPEIFNPKEE